MSGNVIHFLGAHLTYLVTQIYWRNKEYFSWCSSSVVFSTLIHFNSRERYSPEGESPTTVGGILNVTPSPSNIVVYDPRSETLTAVVRMMYSPGGFFQRVQHVEASSTDSISFYNRCNQCQQLARQL